MVLGDTLMGWVFIFLDNLWFIVLDIIFFFHIYLKEMCESISCPALAVSLENIFS